jgi:putative DNA primase/helicase
MTDERPPRPDAVTVNPDGIPEEPRSRDLWLVWRYEWQDDREEWAKIPKNGKGGGYRIDATDPDNGVAFNTAVETYQTGDCDGLGIITDPDDMLVGWDWDDVRDPDRPYESVPNLVTEMIDTLDSYIEVSPSESGYRGFAFGTKPDGPNRADLPCEPTLDDTPHVEVYDGSGGRYLTVTGQRVQGTSETVETRPQEIKAIYDEYIAADEPPKQTGDGGIVAAEDDATPRVDPPEISPRNAATDLSDDELLNRAMNAENGDKFRRLWSGDTSGYPSHSEARQAFANLLAFWTGGDEKRMLRLFRESDLYRDENDRRTFENYEIPTALRGRTEFYDPDAGGDGTTSRPNEPGEDIDRDDLEASRMNVTLAPAEAAAWAGLGEDEDVSDLTDREKAACVWELLDHTDGFHVRVRRDNGSLWAYDTGVWKPEGERALRHAARRALGSMNYGQNVLAELKARARSDPRVELEDDEFGLEPGTVAVENGLVYLGAAAGGAGDDARRNLRPEDYALTRLPVTYDPDATADKWADYVGEWAEDGRADALQEYVGYCLHVGAIPIHRALLLVGSGANGKGTFLSVVRALLGRENTSSVELQTLANEKDAVADFYGSLANIDDDLSARKLGQGLGMFKKLVAGDRVRARQLYEDGFEFDAVGKHLYAANEVPDVDVPDDDEAFWRRWLLVEFPNHYPPDERDPDLRDRLTEPDTLSGVLNWAVEGWDRLLNQGYFTDEERYAQAKRERWQAWGDSIEKFISECVERDDDAENVSTGDVHRVYAAWCRENDERPASQQKLTVALKNEDLDYAKRVRPGGTGTPGTGFKSLGFTDDAPDLEDTPERGTGQQQLG